MIGDAAGCSSTKAELKIVAGARWEIAEIEPKRAVTIFATRVPRMIVRQVEGPTRFVPRARLHGANLARWILR
jgi:hypothetical protein